MCVETKSLVVLLGMIVAVSVLVCAGHPALEWWQWKTQHSRKYKTAAEERARRDVWLQNYEYIQRHNSKHNEGGMTLKLNQFTDMVSSRASS